MIVFSFSVSKAQNKLTSPEIEAKIDALLAKMTLEEKAGQMTQLSLDMVLEGSPYNVTNPKEVKINAEKLKHVIQQLHVGSILNTGSEAQSVANWRKIIGEIQKSASKTRLEIPVLYGIDAIHGANYTAGSTLYPQPLGVAASWNTDLARQLAQISAYEVRASAIPWNFSPAMDLGRNPLWSRTYESFGEDVLMNSRFGVATIEGYQGTDMSDRYRVAACMKHFTGYGAANSGKDRTTAWIPERQLREYFLKQYEDAIKAGAMTVMIHSGDINGVPTHADKYLLTDVLKTELKFQGFAVSDWEDINYLHTRHKVAKTKKDAVRIAIEAGVDMSMTPIEEDFPRYVVELVKEEKLTVARIDDAVRRILRVKFALGLFDKTIYPEKDYKKFADADHLAKAKQAALESLILLKNDANVLPLKKDAMLLVVGPTANSMRSLCGGWTHTWQGEMADSIFANKNTIIESIKAKSTDPNRVKYVDISIEKGREMEKIEEIQGYASKADAVVLCLGESSYTEFRGSINDLRLDENQIFLLSVCKRLGKPIVLVLAEGRPRIFAETTEGIPSILLAFLPGTEGGNAIADVLYGDYNPSGKLPLTYPRYTGGLVSYDHKHTEEKTDDLFPTGKDQYYTPLFPFGHGLSYSKFEYKNLNIIKKSVGRDEKIEIEVEVTNKSSRDGQEVVKLFIGQQYASVAPSVRRLRDFKKVTIKAGQTEKIKFSLDPTALSFVGIDNKWTLESGTFEVWLSGLKENFELK
jgi:beta-glucosidase